MKTNFICLTFYFLCVFLHIFTTALIIFMAVQSTLNQNVAATYNFWRPHWTLACMTRPCQCQSLFEASVMGPTIICKIVLKRLLYICQTCPCARFNVIKSESPTFNIAFTESKYLTGQHRVPIQMWTLNTRVWNLSRIYIDKTLCSTSFLNVNPQVKLFDNVFPTLWLERTQDSTTPGLSERQWV